jgi:hypothetical protein
MNGEMTDTPGKLTRWMHARRLTRGRIILALAVAVVADGTQFLFGWLGLVGNGIDDVIDVVAMVPIMWALGFHVLLLPTFVIKLVPLADMLPTWTGCVVAVIALRKKAERAQPPVIDV